MFKYLRFFKNAISESLVYRSNVFLLFVSQVISVTVFVFLWTAVYNQGGKIGDYTFEGFIVYFVLVGFITFVIQGVDVSWRVGDDIRLGAITNFILRPVSYFWTTFWVILGKSFFNFCIVLFVLTAAAVVHFQSVLIFSDPARDAFFLVSLIFAFFIYILFFYIIGIGTFWLGTVQGLNFFIRTFMFFLAGNIIPVDLLPAKLAAVNYWLPFRFITAVPIGVFTGKTELDPLIFLPAAVWILVLGVTAFLVYKKGIEKYEGFGA